MEEEKLCSLKLKLIEKILSINDIEVLLKIKEFIDQLEKDSDLIEDLKEN